MKVDFSLVSPTTVFEGEPVPDSIQELSRDELRMAFVGCIEMLCDQEAMISFRQESLLAVLLDLSMCWSWLKKGAQEADRWEEGQEYHLVVRRDRGEIEIEEEVAGSKCRVDVVSFVDAGRKLSREVIEVLESQFPDLCQDANYDRMKRFILDVWAGYP